MIRPFVFPSDLSQVRVSPIWPPQRPIIVGGLWGPPWSRTPMESGVAERLEGLAACAARPRNADAGREAQQVDGLRQVEEFDGLFADDGECGRSAGDADGFAGCGNDDWHVGRYILGGSLRECGDANASKNASGHEERKCRHYKLLRATFQTSSQQGADTRGEPVLHACGWTRPGVDDRRWQVSWLTVPCPAAAFPAPSRGQWRQWRGTNRLQLRAQRRISTGFPILPYRGTGTIDEAADSRCAAGCKFWRKTLCGAPLHETRDPILAPPVGYRRSQRGNLKELKR